MIGVDDELEVGEGAHVDEGVAHEEGREGGVDADEQHPAEGPVLPGAEQGFIHDVYYKFIIVKEVIYLTVSHVININSLPTVSQKDVTLEGEGGQWLLMRLG